MKPVTKYEANNGTVCDTPEEADYLDKMDAFGEWYEKRKLYGEGLVHWDDLLEWLQRHKEKVKEILEALA